MTSKRTAKTTRKKATKKPTAKRTTAKKKAVKKKNTRTKVTKKKTAAKTKTKRVGVKKKTASRKAIKKKTQAKKTTGKKRAAVKRKTKVAKTKKKSVSKRKSAKAPVKNAVAKSASKTLARMVSKKRKSTGKKTKKYMNAEQLEYFRNLLSMWKNDLMSEVDQTVNHMKSDATTFSDPADRATQEEEFSFELRTRDRERKLIKKIDNTINLIDKGTYGYCIECAAEIGHKRLQARPTASLCVNCKNLQEYEEKQIKNN